MDIETCLKALTPRYEILSEIGQGGMGRVYRARDLQLDRMVAIKIPLPPEKDDDKWDAVVARFRREGRTLAKLSDPAIMQVYDLGDAAGLPYMVSEWIDGVPLHRRPRPWAPGEITSLAVSLSGALAHAHGSGVIHRDIKPSNVLLRSDGSPVLIDFGIARFADDSTMTRTGSVLGTLVYLAPELLMGRELGPPIDQYALGCVLYELSAGRTWVQATSLAEIVQALLNERPQPIVEIRPEFDPDVAALIHRMIERKPEDRFADMQAALEAWLSLAGEDPPIRLTNTGATRLAGVRRPTPSPEDAPTEESGSQEIAAALSAAEDTAAYKGATPPSVVLNPPGSVDRDMPRLPAGPRATPAHPIPVGAVVSPAKEGGSPEPPNTAAIELGLGRRRRWMLRLILLMLLAVIGYLAFPRALDLFWGDAPVDGARSAVGRNLDGALGDMTTDLLDTAEKSPTKLLAEGYVAFSEGRPREGVDAYSAALAADPSVINDPALIANLVQAATAGSKRAQDLLVTHPNEKVVAALVDRSVYPGYKERHNALTTLERLHSDDKVDWGRVATLDVTEAPDCAQRKNAVLLIEKLGDKRAIPTLRRIRRTRGTERLSNFCLVDDVDRTLAALTRG